MICPSCKKEIEPGAWFCPFCAAQIATDELIKVAVDDLSSYDVELRESSAWSHRDSSSDAVIVGDLVPILEPDAVIEPTMIPRRTNQAIPEGLTPYEHWVATSADSTKTVHQLQAAALMSDEEMRVTMLTLLDRGVVSLDPLPELDPSLLVEVREEVKPPPKIVSRPDRAKLLYEAAIHDREAGNFVSARMNLKLAIALDPDNQHYAALYLDLLAEKPPSALIDHVGGQQLFNEATSAESAGDFDRAISILEKAIKLSRHPVLLNRLGVLYATKRRDFVKAKEMLEGAVEAAPYNPAYVHNLNKVLAYVTPEVHGRDNLWNRIVKKKP
jgi:hypothetical protein